MIFDFLTESCAKLSLLFIEFGFSILFLAILFFHFLFIYLAVFLNAGKKWKKNKRRKKRPGHNVSEKLEKKKIVQSQIYLFNENFEEKKKCYVMLS